MLCGCGGGNKPQTEIPAPAADTVSETAEAVTEAAETSAETAAQETAETQSSTATKPVPSRGDNKEIPDEEMEAQPLSYNEDELKKIAYDKIHGMDSCMNWFECGDFDGDGGLEAFVLYSETSNEDGSGDCYADKVGFVNGSGDFSEIKDKLAGDMFMTPYTMKFGSKGFFTFASTNGGSGSAAYVFGVKNGKPKEADISATDTFAYTGIYTLGGVTYADRSVFMPYHMWFADKIEYDENTDKFKTTMNKGLEAAEKYAEIVVNNENVWVPNLKSGNFPGGEVYFCGFAELTGDDIPEFVVSAGHRGAHGAEGYYLYYFEGDTMKRFKHTDPYSSGTPDPSEPDIEFWREYNDDFREYYYTVTDIDDYSYYQFPLYFVTDTETGAKRYISACQDGSASYTGFYLDEFTFTDGEVTSRNLGIMEEKYDSSGDPVSFEFRRSVGDIDNPYENITKDEFIEVYDELFRNSKNAVVKDTHLNIFIGCTPNSYDPDKKVNYEYSYSELSPDLAFEKLMEDYISKLNMSDGGDYDFDCHIVGGNGETAPLPFEGTISIIG